MLLARSSIVPVVGALSLSQLIGWGSTFWLPAVTGTAMGRDLGMALPHIMAGPTVMLIVIAVVSWSLASIFERYGARPVMVCGSTLGAVGLMIMGLSNSPEVYFLSWAILGLAGAGMLTTPAQIAVTEIAGQNARRALGMLILAGGLTSTIFWPLTGLLQAQWGWRATTLAYAALLLFVCMPLHWIMLARRPKQKPVARAAGAAGTVDRSRFALLAVSLAANGFFTWGFALTIIILFEANGLDHASALTAAAFIGVAQLAGRMVDLLGERRWSGFTIGLVGSALFPLSFVVLLLMNSFVGAMLFATLYGVGSGITTVARATLPLQIFPAAAYARAAARLALPLNLSFAAAPPIFAVLLTSSGPHAALWLAIAISTVAFCTLYSLSRLYSRTACVSPSTCR